MGLVAKVGPQGFTLREVARRAKVSHNAPYRHFQDKDDLLAAVATEGLDRLTAWMNKSMGEGPTAKERLRLVGIGYVEFALKFPQHLAIMFETPCTIEARERPECKAAGMQAFQVFLDAISAA